jgi:hypothetical protein
MRPQNNRSPKDISPRVKALAISLVVNSALLIFIYFGAMNLDVVVIKAGVLAPYPIMIGQLVYYAYWIVFAGFLIGYVAYNRAFTRKGVTAEMLPESWSDEQKQEYVDDGARRQEKSKWMLSVIIPLLVTIAADAIYLFTWPIVQNLFSIK